MSHEQIFIDNLDGIEAVIRHVCARHHASDDEREEFRSLAHIKLIEDDYRVLRHYKGRAGIRAYLNVVLEREFLDYRIAKWGKWRPSVEAQRSGEVAVILERLIVRDRLTFDEAVEILRTNHRVTETRDALWAVVERLPKRLDRRPESDKALLFVPDPGRLPDEELHESERSAEQQRAVAALERALRQLEPEDRLIVKLQFYDGLKQVEIARALQLEQKKFYRRCEQILERLKGLLQIEGIDPRAMGFE